MRYHHISHSRQAPLLRWYHFPGRRAWLDVETPACEVILQFMGPGVDRIEPVVQDRDGHRLASTQGPPAEVPGGRNLFPNQPAHMRRLTGLRFDFQGRARCRWSMPSPATR